MKKVLFAAVVVLLGACSQIDVIENRSQEEAIEFGTYTAMPTRASGLIANNVFPDGGKMGVYAYYTGNTAWDGSSTPNFMYDQLVTKSGNNYVYSPTKYWPNNDGHKITFFAYYPHSATGLTWKDHNPSPATYTNTSTGFPVANMVIQSAAKDQVDFMYAIAKDQKKSAANDPVQLSFKHALTQVNLEAKLSSELVKDNGGSSSNTTVTVTGIKFKNIFKNGTMDMAADTPSWTPSTPSDFEAVLSDAAGVAITGTTAQTVTADTEVFVMMPQKLEDNAAIEVTYKVKTIDTALNGGYSEVTNTTQAKISGTWTPNANVLYTLTIGLNEVKVTSSIITWEIQAEETIQ